MKSKIIHFAAVAAFGLLVGWFARGAQTSKELNRADAESKAVAIDLERTQSSNAEQATHVSVLVSYVKTMADLSKEPEGASGSP